MKKLNKLTLKKVEVEQGDLLQKRDLKYIMGGYDTGGYGGYGGTGGYGDDPFFCYNCYCLTGSQRASSDFISCGHPTIDVFPVVAEQCKNFGGYSCSKS